MFLNILSFAPIRYSRPRGGVPLNTTDPLEINDLQGIFRLWGVNKVLILGKNRKRRSVLCTQEFLAKTMKGILNLCNSFLTGF